MSGEIQRATSATQSMQNTSGPSGQPDRVHPLPYSKQPGLESDEEIRRVPEMGGESAGTSASRPETGSTAGPDRVQGTGESQKKRGRSPADKESKRLKRYICKRDPVRHLLNNFPLDRFIASFVTCFAGWIDNGDRLLRNRVSAQQARERKKAYLIDLEARVKDFEIKNSELKERLSTLQNENQMLRQILKNTTASRRGSNSGTNNAE